MHRELIMAPTEIGSVTQQRESKENRTVGVFAFDRASRSSSLSKEPLILHRSLVRRTSPARALAFVNNRHRGVHNVRDIMLDSTGTH